MKLSLPEIKCLFVSSGSEKNLISFGLSPSLIFQGRGFARERLSKQRESRQRESQDRESQDRGVALQDRGSQV